MEGTEEKGTPSFATSVRGYDRMQVDDYIDHLNQWIEQADTRAQQSEAAVAEATVEVEELRRQASFLGADSPTSTPVSMKALGDRVGAIMRSSFQEAKKLQARAEEEARATTAAAEERAAGIVAQATARADELSRASEDLFVQAQEALAGANEAVAKQVNQARARAEAEGHQMVEQARAEAGGLARQAAAKEKEGREQLARLDEHRLRVLEEIGLLHERLGSISQDLSTTQARPEAPSPPDEQTQIVELPTPAQPDRRKAASSAR